MRFLWQEKDLVGRPPPFVRDRRRKSERFVVGRQHIQDIASWCPSTHIHSDGGFDMIRSPILRLCPASCRESRLDEGPQKYPSIITPVVGLSLAGLKPAASESSRAPREGGPMGGDGRGAVLAGEGQAGLFWYSHQQEKQRKKTLLGEDRWMDWMAFGPVRLCI
ncbi:hypothetical protein LX36DRAFT_101432 [Colletotrichum falcatum]|nr:hypothetical protein LX36DRAFT_101432 [Colletotrichum falcatum]